MTNKELAQKNYNNNLWTDDMLEKLKVKGALIQADVTQLKADKIAKESAKTEVNKKK